MDHEGDLPQHFVKVLTAFCHFDLEFKSTTFAALREQIVEQARKSSISARKLMVALHSLKPAYIGAWTDQDWCTRALGL
eukprot:7990836-Karenia_brevis.AAC.1